jgi:transposase
MERHKKGIERGAINISPMNIEEMVSEANAVRAIEAIVERFDVKELGFKYSETKETGRKPYSPRDMLKLYIYGYYNGIRSSRKLEQECGRNIELIWLLGWLKPDFKTIADFRKDNKEAIQQVFTKFSLICDELGLIGKEIVAIDGSKFRASNNSNAYWTKKKVTDKRAEYAKSAGRYTKLLEHCDREEGSRQTKGYTRADIEARLDYIQSKMNELEAVAPMVEEQGDVSLTDPDARKMKQLNGANEVSHNVQIAVDEKNHIVVAVDVTSEAVEYEQFYPMSMKTKEALGVDELTVLADRGYFSGEQLDKAEKAGIIPIVPKPEKAWSPDPAYTSSYFVYDEGKDVYICPQGKVLPRKQKRNPAKKETDYGSKHVCKDCTVRDKCTTSKDGRYIRRDEFQAAADRAFLRVWQNRSLYKKRKMLVEHIFGTVKACFGFRYLSVRRTDMVKTDSCLVFLAYNLKRALNILGTKALSEA